MLYSSRIFVYILTEYCLHVMRLWKRQSGLYNLVGEISRKPSIQVVAWILLIAFSHVYSENQEQKAQLKTLESYSGRKHLKSWSIRECGCRKEMLLKRNHVFVTRTEVKMASGHLRNQPNSTFHWLRDEKGKSTLFWKTLLWEESSRVLCSRRVT